MTLNYTFLLMCILDPGSYMPYLTALWSSSNLEADRVKENLKYSTSIISIDRNQEQKLRVDQNLEWNLKNNFIHRTLANQSPTCILQKSNRNYLTNFRNQRNKFEYRGLQNNNINFKKTNHRNCKKNSRPVLKDQTRLFHLTL